MAFQYGMSEQTAAARNTINRVLARRAAAGGRRRSKARAPKAVRKAAKRVTKAGRAVKGKLKKGSAAAKRYMASIRRKRRR